MSDSGTPHATLPPADRAVAYMLDRVTRDPRLAYFLGDTEALRLLCHAEAARLGVDPVTHHDQVNRGLRTEPPPLAFDFARLHNALRILINIDGDVFEACGGDPADWPSFRDDPHRFFIRTSDDVAEKLFAHMLTRMK